MYTKNKKEIYKFTIFQEIEEEKEIDVEKEFDVQKEVEVEKTRKGKDGQDEKYKDKETRKFKEKKIVKEKRKEVTKKEHNFVLKEPTRRQMEEADMEYSIEMSKCVKQGILTKAMLLNKYSDTGGLMSEADAKQLYEMYGKLGELQTDLSNLNMRTENKEDNEEKRKEITEELANLRRTIARSETNFSALLNHTADTRAQNKVIIWYILNLTNIQDGDKTVPFFKGETFEDKMNNFYQMEEDEDELLGLVYDKLTAFISFWYFSAAATEADFVELNKDIEEGNL